MSINIIEAFATANKCYQVAIPLYPQGIMLHSIGVPQPNADVMAKNYNQYRPNGKACASTLSCSNIAAATAWGSVYEIDVQNLSFPSGLFTAAPEYCSITYGGGSAKVLSIETMGLPSESKTQPFYITSAAEYKSITSAKVQVHAIGRWK